ncbi:putative RNA methyltransferase [Skeletonema marinoi]|uniref:RNA methyltransferase n=1 Tax=Skeletonema marinoi TaxID=267567 RepID=A0AAD9D6M6_9STRA|nr:putative RNA methyltransferase [Skeletonema marinoi]
MISRLALTLLVVLPSIIIILPSAHPLTSAAFCSTCCYSHRRTSPHYRITLADNDIVDPSNDIDGYLALQRRLHLTPDEANLIRNRIGGITPRKKLQNCNNAIDDNVTAGKEQPTMERNLAYLEEHLGMTMEQLRRIVVGYPLVLKMKEANLMSAVEFFANALWYDVDGGDDVDCSHTSISYDLQEDYKKRLAAFLCESPQLLEYNVEKRLKPRLERLRIAKENQAKEVGSAAAAGVDEEMLRSIATLTESRFETWLLQINGTKSDGNNEATTKATQLVSPPPQRQPSNSPSAYVILSNLQSGGNIGNIVRSASIFGCEECIVVGQKRYNTE